MGHPVYDRIKTRPNTYSKYYSFALPLTNAGMCCLADLQENIYFAGFNVRFGDWNYLYLSSAYLLQKKKKERKDARLWATLAATINYTYCSENTAKKGLSEKQRVRSLTSSQEKKKKMTSRKETSC